MKVETNHVKTESSGNLGRSSRFTIQGSAKAFDSLSSGLYKDSIRAIVRELGTNAADAHVEAGKRQVPFVAHLPTAMEPWFMVKDLGVGLDDRQIRGFSTCVNEDCNHTEDADFDETNRCPKCAKKMEFIPGIYATYFASTKVHSNDYTGCLGLGSKSPFAYTDSFTVTSVKDGVKRIYTCFKDEGMPGVTKMHEEPTTDHAGVEVKFPVQSKDFAEFRSKALDVYRWFSPRPMVTGIDARQYDDERIVLETGDWAIMSEKRTWSVLMGNVHYDIDFSGLDQTFKNSLTVYEKFVASDVGPLMKVSIGEVDMAVSRESLKYTPKTYAALKKRLTQVVQDCVAEAEKRIAVCKRLWDARVALKGLQESYWLAGLLGSGVKWRGKIVNTQIHIGAERPRIGCKSYTLCRSRRGKVTLSNPEASVIPVGPNITIFRNDVTTNWNTRIQAYLAQYGATEVTRWNAPKYVHQVFMIYTIPGRNVDDFIAEEDLGDVVRDVSELPEPPRIRRETRKTSKVIRLRGYGMESPSYAWEDADIDLEDGEEHVYFEVNGYKWSVGDLMTRKVERQNEYGTDDGWRQPIAFKAMWDKIYTFIPEDEKIEMTDVIGIRSGMLNRIQKLPNWVRFDAWLKARCLEADDMRLSAAKMHLWNCLRSDVTGIIGDIKGTDVLKPTSTFRRMHEIYADLSNQQVTQAMHCSNACNYVGVPLPDLAKLSAEEKKLAADFKKRYPMLCFLKDARTLDERAGEDKAVIEYVNMMDKRGIKKEVPITPAPAPANSEEVAA